MHTIELAAMVAEAIQRERLAQAAADRPARRVLAPRGRLAAYGRPALARLNRRVPRLSGDASTCHARLQS